MDKKIKATSTTAGVRFEACCMKKGEPHSDAAKRDEYGLDIHRISQNAPKELICLNGLQEPYA